MLTRDIRL